MSTARQRPPAPKPRRPSFRSNALRNLKHIETDSAHHLTGPFRPQTPLGAQYNSPVEPPLRSPNGTPNVNRWSHESLGFLADLKSMRWIVVPCAYLLLIGAAYACAAVAPAHSQGPPWGLHRSEPRARTEMLRNRQD